MEHIIQKIAPHTITVLNLTDVQNKHCPRLIGMLYNGAKKRTFNCTKFL